MPKELKITKAQAVERELRDAAAGKRYRVRVEGVAKEVPAGWVPSTILHAVGGWRYAARLFDLKKSGRILGYDSKPFEGSRIYIYRGRLEEGKTKE